MWKLAVDRLFLGDGRTKVYAGDLLHQLTCVDTMHKAGRSNTERRTYIIGFFIARNFCETRGLGGRDPDSKGKGRRPRDADSDTPQRTRQKSLPTWPGQEDWDETESTNEFY